MGPSSAPAPRDGRGPVPPLLRLAAGAQAAEALGLCVAVAFGVVDAASGRTATVANAAGFIVLEAVIAAGLGAIAAGLARARPWSRTPALLTQVFTAMIAVWLLQARDYGWGVPALVLALAGLAGLAVAGRALNHQR